MYLLNIDKMCLYFSRGYNSRIKHIYITSHHITHVLISVYLAWLL